MSALRCGTLLTAMLAAQAAITAGAAETPVEFNRDIRPLLSNRCFRCHGPSESDREAGLRLDQQASATGRLESGETAIVAGDSRASELIARVTHSDPDLRMPPADSNKKPFSADEVALLKRWIDQGAEYQPHWAFIAPRKSSPADVSLAEGPGTPIDSFILARLEREGLTPSPEADRRTLIRRVTLDLTGLPPTPAEVDAFVADTRPDAYERLVERLLRSPRYGEHMARFWLDAARYGDTHGLHLDNYREMWPYRDWVVRAFNDNLPYSDFLTWQLAGDLLPDATLDQQVATGFNRCHVTTNEGGSIKEEVYVRNVVDRVETFGTVMLGLTIGCTRCHDHKYDPLTQRGFYELFAFFNSLDGNPMDGNKAQHPPVLRVPGPEQTERNGELKRQLETVRAEIERAVDAYVYTEPARPAPTEPPKPVEVVWIEDDVPTGATAEGGWQWVAGPQPVYSGKQASTRTATGLSQHFFHGAPSKLKVAKGDRLFAHVYLDPKNPPKEIMLQWNDGSWDHRAYWGGNHIDWGAVGSPGRRHHGELPEAGKWVRLEVEAEAVGLAGREINGWAFTQFDGTVHWDRAGIVSTSGQSPHYESLAEWITDRRADGAKSLPAGLQAILKKEDAARTADEIKQLSDHFIEHIYAGTRGQFAPLHARVAALEKELVDVEKSYGTTLVWKETAQPREAFILERGEYERRGEKVERNTPQTLPPLAEGLPRDRLGLARWLLAPEHPLTARVAVNRYWQQFFGTGLVETADDFGNQGSPPSHPELLDWLAVDFRENGWDVKRLMRQIVTSRAYRQASRVTPGLHRRDPANRLLARGPRFRLDAEMLRDQALFVSGLLVEKRGGPSVKPPQPGGLWFAVGYSGSDTVRFKKDTGAEKVYRRTLYTFIKRTAPPPQMSTLDGPSRESCSVRRERTNTPLQALLLMNDPQYFEAARHLAQRVLADSTGPPDARARAMFVRAASRLPDDDELAELTGAHKDHLAHYRAHPDAARQLVVVGETPPDAQLDPVELAAWTMVANLVLNLDEVITKE